MYLLDSILKNIGEPYVSIFSRNVATLFLRAYTAVNVDEKARLQRLAGTWPGIFPPEVIVAVQRCWAGATATVPPAGASMPPYIAHPGAAVPHPAGGGGMGAGMPVATGAGSGGGHFSARPGGLGEDQKYLLQSLVASGVLSAEPRQGAGAAGAAPPALGEPTTTAFTAEFLRTRNEAVLEALYFAQEYQCKITGVRFRTEAELSAHMDALFARKKRQKDDEPIYRRWYVSLENWQQGIIAEEADAPNMFDPARDGAGGGDG